VNRLILLAADITESIAIIIVIQLRLITIHLSKGTENSACPPTDGTMDRSVWCIVKYLVL